MKQKKKRNKPERLKPISLYPLKWDEALSLFMKVDPEKVKKREKQCGLARDGRG